MRKCVTRNAFTHSHIFDKKIPHVGPEPETLTIVAYAGTQLITWSGAPDSLRAGAFAKFRRDTGGRKSRFPGLCEEKSQLFLNFPIFSEFWEIAEFPKPQIKKISNK